MTALTLVYRPKRLEDIVGQPHVTTIVKAMVKKNDLPPVLIFAGASGTGKTSTARILAAALNCENKTDNEPCGECAMCLSVWETQNSSVIEIDAASSGTVEAVRKIKEITYYAHQSLWRVIILDEAQSMTEDAFNVLLKTLEEPPENTVFVLITTEVFKIPNTIRTRAMQFEFRRLVHDTIVKYLSKINLEKNFNASDMMLSDIAKNSKGSLRDAIMQLDQASRIGITRSEEFRKTFGVIDSAGSILNEIIKGNKPAMLDLIVEAISRTGDALILVNELNEFLRDLIIIKAHGIPPCLPSQLEERTSIAQLCDEYQLTSAIKLLWNSKERIRTETDQITSGQIIGLLLSDALRPVRPTKTEDLALQPINTNVQDNETPLSLEEMGALINI